MEDHALYLQIAEALRQDILSGKYKPGQELPTIRQLCSAWNCSPGTVQRAFKRLSDDRLLVSHQGQGTKVASYIAKTVSQTRSSLKLTQLVSRLENVLVEAVNTGYAIHEIQQAMDTAIARWQLMNTVEKAPPRQVLKFAGSHDMIVTELVHAFFGQMLGTVDLNLVYNGSQGGLVSLAERKVELAGCHLWDAESDCYNWPFIQKILPDQPVTVVTLAHRRIGLIVPPGNPQQIKELADLLRPGIRFVNRQPGSGTRVWLDSTFARLGIDPHPIIGYRDERSTHSDVARAVAEGTAGVGLGLESAAQAYRLDFVFLARERYDLVMHTETMQHTAIKRLVEWLGSEGGKQFVGRHKGYENQETGLVRTGPP